MAPRDQRGPSGGRSPAHNVGYGSRSICDGLNVTPSHTYGRAVALSRLRAQRVILNAKIGISLIGELYSTALLRLILTLRLIKFRSR